MTNKTEKESTKTMRKYSKSAFLNAEKDNNKRVLLNVLLEDDKSYSKLEVEKLVKDWSNKKLAGKKKEGK